jgi:hypothetical protein
MCGGPGGELMDPEMTHIFTWGNGEKRATLKGRECRILVHGKKRSVRVEFENGQLEIVDFYALRKKTGQTPKQLNLFEKKKPLMLAGTERLK